MNKYISPKYYEKSFHCPHCGVLSSQTWGLAHALFQMHYIGIQGFTFAHCTHCQCCSIWSDEQMIYPIHGNAPMPSEDMPEEIAQLYLEARDIANLSPRGASAILRLAVQKLCRFLGEKGENINEDIASLVKKGLPEKLQKAMDSVRVIGNQAVHPGQIDFDDDADVAAKLFVFINIICENQITQGKMIDQFYTEILPEKSKKAIEKRDNS